MQALQQQDDSGMVDGDADVDESNQALRVRVRQLSIILATGRLAKSHKSKKQMATKNEQKLHTS